MNIFIQEKPDYTELHGFFQLAYDELDPVDAEKFTDDTDQNLLENWIDLKYAISYALDHGVILEARDETKGLMGVVIAGKQHPISWPDGHKWEIFIIASSPQFRKRGIASRLLEKMEVVAQDNGARAIVVNTHVFWESAKRFYERNGYRVMGTLTGYYDNGEAVFLKKDW
jgi:ribosomal protein S18 acetylase RimI-like enzyme